MSTLERETYWLEGASPRPFFSLRKMVPLLVFGGIAVAMLVGILVTQSMWLAVAFLILAAVIAALWLVRDSNGQLWLLRTVGDQIRGWFARHARWDEFDPALEQKPFWLSTHLVYGVSRDEDPRKELAILQDGANHLVAVLEVSGGGEGIQSVAQQVRQDRAFSTILRKAAEDPTVTQLDFVTRGVAERHKSARREIETQLTGWVSAAIRESMLALVDEAETTARQYRTWVVVRMSYDELMEKVRAESLKPTPTLVAEAAFDTVARITRLLADNEIPVLAGLSPRRLGAVIRGFLNPSYSVDDTSGVDDFWGGFVGFQPTPRGDAIAVFAEDGVGEWYHSAASIPREAWPKVRVGSRWLAPLVFNQHESVGENPAPRVVMTQFALLPTWRARGFAQSQMTTASAGRLHEEKRRVVSLGESHVEESSTLTVGQDIAVFKEAGVFPITRVMVSSKTRRGLRLARESVSNAVSTMGVSGQGLHWDDRRQAVSMLRCLPLGLEVPRS